MKTTARLTRACLSGGGALLLLTGCFKLARTTPPVEEYVLGGSPALSVATAPRESGGMSIGLRRLDLAPYLATPAIVHRRGSRIEQSGFQRWSEEPSAGIMRTLSAALNAAPNIQAVDVAPWPVQTRHDYLVQLHITHLEGVAAEDATVTTGEVQVSASWELIRAADGALVARGFTDRKEAGWTVGDYLGLVKRIDKGLVGLAGELSSCLVRVRAAVPATTPVSTVPAAVQFVSCDPR